MISTEAQGWKANKSHTEMTQHFPFIIKGLGNKCLLPTVITPWGTERERYKIMMKHEFEALYGQEVTVEEYKKIEYCYIRLTYLVKEKKDIVKLYKLLGADMFDRLYRDVKEYDMCVRTHEKEADRLAEKLRYCEYCIEQFKQYVNCIDLILKNNVNYVNSRTKELLGDLDRYESEA